MDYLLAKKAKLSSPAMEALGRDKKKDQYLSTHQAPYAVLW